MQEHDMSEPVSVERAGELLELFCAEGGIDINDTDRIIGALARRPFKYEGERAAFAEALALRLNREH